MTQIYSDNRKLKVMLVRPRPHPETIGLQYVMKVEPLELEVLAAVLPDNCMPVIIDLIMEKGSIESFIKREQPDIMCVTGYITNIPEMIEYCKIAKKVDAQIVTICGGVHCEVCPGDLNSPYVDFRVVRDVIPGFRNLINHISGMGPKPEGVLAANESTFLPLSAPDLKSYPVLPRRELTQGFRKKYFYIFHHPVALLKTAFGCPYSCNFCFCRKITGGNYIERALDDVMKEIENISEKHIYIVDDNFLFSRDRVAEFIRLLKQGNVQKTFLIYGRADFIAHNPEIIKDFKEVGLKTVIVGLESVFEHELDAYSKNSTVKINQEAMRVLKSNGIDCFATIILSPEWGREEFRECGAKLREMGVSYVNLQPYTPLSGTDSDDSSVQIIESREDFHKWDLAHITVKPAELSIREYYREIIKLYQFVLFQPKTILTYITTYRVPALLKMLFGSFMVYRQYLRKMREAGHA